MATTDYFFTSIKPEPIIVSCHRGNDSKLTEQQAATQDQVSQQTNPLWPGKTRVYPSMLADKQVPVLNLTEFSITSQADLQAAFQSICLCSHGREESKTTEYLSIRQRFLGRRSKSTPTYISGRKIIWNSQRFGTDDTGSIGSFYGAVQPHSRKRTAKTAKD